MSCLASHLRVTIICKMRIYETVLAILVIFGLAAAVKETPRIRTRRQLKDKGGGGGGGGNSGGDGDRQEIIDNLIPEVGLQPK